MTNEEILNLFYQKYPELKIEDYRPLYPEMYTKDLVGITIWLKNGDVIQYYPKMVVNELPVKPKVDIDALINKIETEFSWDMYDDWGNSTDLHDGLVDIIRKWAERNCEENEINKC